MSQSIISQFDTLRSASAVSSNERLDSRLADILSGRNVLHTSRQIDKHKLRIANLRTTVQPLEDALLVWHVSKNHTTKTQVAYISILEVEDLELGLGLGKLLVGHVSQSLLHRSHRSFTPISDCEKNRPFKRFAGIIVKWV